MRYGLEACDVALLGSPGVGQALGAVMNCPVLVGCLSIARASLALEADVYNGCWILLGSCKAQHGVSSIAERMVASLLLVLPGRCLAPAWCIPALLEADCLGHCVSSTWLRSWLRKPLEYHDFCIVLGRSKASAR